MDKTKYKRENHTLIEWLNSLTSPQWSRHLSQPILRREGEGKSKGVFLKRKRVGVVNNIYLRKTLEKPKRGLRILKIQVWELFTHREGINTSRVRHKRRQPLIECAQRDFKIIYFLKSSELLLLHYFF